MTNNSKPLSGSIVNGPESPSGRLAGFCTPLIPGSVAVAVRLSRPNASQSTVSEMLTGLGHQVATETTA